MLRAGLRVASAAGRVSAFAKRARQRRCLRTISQRAYLGKAQESRVLESRRDEQQPVVASQGFRSRPGARASIRMSRTVAFIDRRRGMRNVKIGVVR